MIEINKSDITAIKRELGLFQNKAPTVLSRVINRTVDNIKTNMKRQAAQRYNITQKNVGATLNDNKANPKELSGYVESKGAKIPLIKFKVSPNRIMHYKSGRPSPNFYSVAVIKSGVKKPLDKNPKAFIAIMKNGHKGVYKRTGRWDSERNFERTREAKRSKNEKAHSKHNEIIQELVGLSVPQMIGSEAIINSIMMEAGSTIEKRIDAEINYILSKGASK